MELTREKAIEEHRKMWRWLAEHPDKNKSDYFELMGIDDSDLYNRCFLCTYAEAEMERQQVDDYVGCNYCPLDWGGKGCNEIDYSLYDAWVYYGGISADDRCRGSKTDRRAARKDREMRKKYRIRKYSPVWWAARVCAGAGAIAGSYAWVLLLSSMPV